MVGAARYRRRNSASSARAPGPVSRSLCTTMRCAVRGLKAPNSTRRSLHPLTGTTACCPRRAQAARNGGNSRNRVASANSRTSPDCICLKRRTIALFSASRAGPARDTHNEVVSSHNRTYAGDGARCGPIPDSRTPRANAWLREARSSSWRDSQVAAGLGLRWPPRVPGPDRRPRADGPSEVDPANPGADDLASTDRSSDARCFGSRPPAAPPRPPGTPPPPAAPLGPGETEKGHGSLAKPCRGDADRVRRTLRHGTNSHSSFDCALSCHCGNTYGHLLSTTSLGL